MIRIFRLTAVHRVKDLSGTAIVSGIEAVVEDGIDQGIRGGMVIGIGMGEGLVVDGKEIGGMIEDRSRGR